MTGTLSLALVQKLHKINGAHPLTLVADVETRRILQEVVTLNIYTISPAAMAAIKAALAEVETISCPLMPLTEFELVAYADELDNVKCIKSTHSLGLTAGKTYPLSTGSYRFTDSFTRKKVHFNEERQETYALDHQCQLSGSDRYIQVTNDSGKDIRFMDRPRYPTIEFEEKVFWEYFEKPVVKTVTDALPQHVKQNNAVLRACEMLADYVYYEGQKEYLSRVGVKDAALIAAETGTGKTLKALSLITLKCPNRSLIIAPQGTMRTSEDEDNDDALEYNASQWLKEIARFTPHMQVWELFSYEDFKRICAMNGGELPSGVYVTYYQAFFSNGAMEGVPESWDDVRLNKWAKSKRLSDLPLIQPANSNDRSAKRFWCDSVGREVNGVRCIIDPCLATRIGHLFDCVMLDEAHFCTNLGARVTQMLIRLQPKFRYALTATPIPNIVSNLFSLMGWLAVPDWYKGGIRNAAFPYAREDLGRFNATFLSQERDVTQEDMNRAKDPKWRGKCIKESPVISSPARLLKILKPTMAFISKRDCNKGYIPPEIVDVRVPMGKEQAVLYNHFLDRANIEASNALVRARKQTAYLRNICADPAGFTHGGPKVLSNLNPKVIAILELVRDIMVRGEQVVIVNSRVGLSNTLSEKLADAGIVCARIDSTITAEQQSHQSNLFKDGKARTLLMGIKCAASHSFDACPNLIIGSLEYSYGPYCQAIGRIDRVTNKVKKKIYCILHKLSIEEIMYDVVSVKGDAATICLRGERVPRDFKPVDASETLAKAIERFDLSGSKMESECESQWPKLCEAMRKAI